MKHNVTIFYFFLGLVFFIHMNLIVLLINICKFVNLVKNMIKHISLLLECNYQSTTLNTFNWVFIIVKEIFAEYYNEVIKYAGTSLRFKEKQRLKDENLQLVKDDFIHLILMLNVITICLLRYYLMWIRLITQVVYRCLWVRKLLSLMCLLVLKQDFLIW